MPHLQKFASVAFPCRVCTRNCSMEQESIQCDGCECWMHQHCIGMSTTPYVQFSEPNLQYFADTALVMVIVLIPYHLCHI